MFHPLVFAAETFPVRYGTENTGAEQSVFLRLECAVVDGFRLCYFAMRPRANLFWRSQTDPDAVKIGDGRRPVVRIRSNQFNLPPKLWPPHSYTVGFRFISSTSR